MKPRMTAYAPVMPTAAYTMLLTNLVLGLVMDEKNVALRL